MLAVAVGPNVFFDPSREELAVADVVLSVTFTSSSSSPPRSTPSKKHPSADDETTQTPVHLLAIRTVEPPGRRLTSAVGTVEERSSDAGGPGTWKKRAGGVRRDVVNQIVTLIVSKGGVGEEVLAGLEGWV